jgi:HEAT repeat protein
VRSMFEIGLLPRKLDAALRDAQHEKPDVRVSALSDLARHARSGDAPASRALVAALADPVEGVRAAAALGLADAGIETAVSDLVTAARDVSLHVRQMALLALGELANREQADVVEVLLSARNADAPAERFQALLALHQLGAERAEQAIIESMVDPDAEVRRLSFRVAEAHWADQDLPELVRARARAALSEKSAVVRNAAALLLAHFGDVSGQHVLLALLGGQVKGASPEDEQAAMEAAAALELAEARPLLERRMRRWLGRDPLAFHAQVALARLGDERARADIARGLEAWTYSRRTLAVVAAGRAGLVGLRPQIRQLVAQSGRVDEALAEEALTLLDADARRAEGAES